MINEKAKKAIKLRKQGYSYALIKKKIGMSKSMLSYCLEEIPFTPNKQPRGRINDACLKSVQAKHRQKMESVKKAHQEAKKEIGTLSKRDWLMIGIGLYLGDGSKDFEQIQLSNSNPDIIKLATKWFKKCCGVKTKNLKPYIHSYPDLDIIETEQYWSKII